MSELLSASDDWYRKVAELEDDCDVSAGPAKKKSPNDHTLNACLARVIGLKIITGYCEGSEAWVFHRNGEPDVWSPLTNPAQMEEVEAWLIEKYKRLAFTMHWGGSNWHVTIRPYREKECEGLDPDKKRAFAMAIWAMEQPQTKESA